MGAWFGVRTVHRKNRSLSRIFCEEHVEVVLVADVQPTWYHVRDPEHPFRFHPGMGLLRLQAMERGEQDRLLAAANIQPGDSVLDATLGLGVDALVLAAGVRDEGHVLACESSWVLARTFVWALQHRFEYEPLVAEALARVQVHEADHLEVLAKLPDESVDVVYFDPMFRKPTDKTTPLDAIRPFAEPQPLREDAWRQAQRVARRAVVMKERPGSGEFDRFGLVPDKRRGRFAYGVWRKR